MKLEFRNYGGKLFRPKAHVAQKSDSLIIAFSWGAAEDAVKAASIYSEHMDYSQNDDATKIGTQSTIELSPLEQMLFGVQRAHDYLFEKNKDTVQSAVEFLVLQKNEKTVYWVQVGAPALILKETREDFSVHTYPLIQCLSLSHHYQQKAPLFHQALGTKKKIQPHAGEFQVSHHELVLLARDHMSPNIYAQTDFSISHLSRLLSEDNAEEPFWLGHVSF